MGDTAVGYTAVGYTAAGFTAVGCKVVWCAAVRRFLAKADGWACGSVATPPMALVDVLVVLVVLVVVVWAVVAVVRAAVDHCHLILLIYEAAGCWLQAVGCCRLHEHVRAAVQRDV